MTYSEYNKLRERFCKIHSDWYAVADDFDCSPIIHNLCIASQETLVKCLAILQMFYEDNKEIEDVSDQSDI